MLAGWKGISDEGQDVPFSETALGRCWTCPAWPPRIVLAYANAHRGRPKKLSEAAEHWAQAARRTTPRRWTTFARLAPSEMLASLQDASPAEEFEVLPECWPTVDLFLRVQTQWRFAGMGHRWGSTTMRPTWLCDASAWPTLKAKDFAGLQIMEVAAPTP